MGSVIVKLLIFSILINLSAGIMMYAVVDNNGDRIFDNTAQSGYVYGDGTKLEDMNTELEKTINPAGSIDDKGDQIYRVLDMMSLGFTYRFFTTLDDYIYGFINIIQNVFGRFLEPEVESLLFGESTSGAGTTSTHNIGLLKTVLTLCYILMGITLFTGKDVMEDI